MRTCVLLSAAFLAVSAFTAAASEAPAAAQPERVSPLAAEDSIFLRGVLDSPIRWRPWGPEAFAEAKRLARPVFVSIGYATCYWTARMDREAFRSPEVAALLNENCIPIKVDRFERPDLDRFYMRFIENRTRRGGWPLNVLMSQEGMPITGAAYMRDHDTERPDFMRTMSHPIRAWQNDPAFAQTHTRSNVEAFARHLEASLLPDFKPAPELIDQAYSQMVSQFDPVHGGFSKVPKFPPPARLMLLWRLASLPGPEGERYQHEARKIIISTLEGMARGAIHDPLGGGFFRYALDDAWRRPYFEKMSFDQALMAESYLKGYQLTGREDFAQIVRETLAYVERELGSPEGGFYNAEGCESPQAAEAAARLEGAFYVWDQASLQRVAGASYSVLESFFDVRGRGNLPAGAALDAGLREMNVLSIVRPLEEVSRRLDLPAGQAERLLQEGCAALWQERNRRPRPLRDELLITQANGALISAFAQAGAVLNEEVFLDKARRAAEFVRGRLWRPADQTLFRCCVETRAPRHLAVADDYVWLIKGVLDLYEATGEAGWLRWARELQQAFDKGHADTQAGGYFDARSDVKDLPVNIKNVDDASGISTNAVAGLNLIRLGVLLQEPGRFGQAEKILASSGRLLSQNPGVLAGLTAVAESLLRLPVRVILKGDADDPGLAAARRKIAALAGRPVCVLQVSPDAEAWLKELGSVPAPVADAAGGPAAFVMEGGRVTAGPFSAAELDKYLPAPR